MKANTRDGKRYPKLRMQILKAMCEDPSGESYMSTDFKKLAPSDKVSNRLWSMGQSGLLKRTKTGYVVTKYGRQAYAEMIAQAA